MTELWDVVVVGAGPVGQIAALLLAQHGHRVLVVERWAEPYPLPRAVHYDDEVARILQAVGIADEMAALTEPVSRYELRNGEGRTLIDFESPGNGPCGWSAANAFYQPVLEQVLERTLKGHKTAHLRRGWEATELHRTRDSVCLTVCSAYGMEEEVHGRYVIGADGANSFVRKQMLTSVTDLGFQFDWLVVDVLPHEERVWDPPALQHCDTSRPVTAVPGGPGRRRWEFMVLPDESTEEMNRPATAWRLLDPWGVTPDNADLERHAVYRFQACWADQWHEDRVVLAGDAAHLMPPFFAQGMCSGVRDAASLAWRLDRVLKGASTTLLDTYASERIGHVRTYIDVSVMLGSVVCVLDPAEAVARDEMLTSGPPPTGPGFDSPARLGAGLFVDDDPAGGFLSPQGRVRSADRDGLFDDVVGVGLVLLTTDAAPLPAPAVSTFEALSGRVVRLTADAQTTAPDVVTDIDGAYHRWLDGLDRTWALVRPDFYVYGTASTPAEAAGLIEGLARHVPEPAMSPEGTRDASTNTNKEHR